MNYIERLDKLEEERRVRGIKINFTKDDTIPIHELDSLSKELDKLRKKFVFIKDWEIIR